MVDFRKALKEKMAKRAEKEEVIEEPKGILKPERRCRFSDDIVNDFTRELDKYTDYVDGSYCNYIYPERIKRAENKHFVSFRYPGATRGHLEIDNNNVITKIVIYEDSDVYNKGVREAINKFIGWTLEL